MNALLLRPEFLVSRRVLALERALPNAVHITLALMKCVGTYNEPPEHSNRPVLIGLRICNIGEELWALAPVCYFTRTPLSESIGYAIICQGSVPGNSVSDMGERMNGGAVSDERSPDTDAILGPHEVRDW